MTRHTYGDVMPREVRDVEGIIFGSEENTDE